MNIFFLDQPKFYGRICVLMWHVPWYGEISTVIISKIPFLRFWHLFDENCRYLELLECSTIIYNKSRLFPFIMWSFEHDISITFVFHRDTSINKLLIFFFIQRLPFIRWYRKYIVTWSKKRKRFKLLISQNSKMNQMSFVDFDAWIMRRFLSEASIIMAIFLPICFAHLSSFVLSYNDRSTYDLSIHCAIFQQPFFFLNSHPIFHLYLFAFN